MNWQFVVLAGLVLATFCFYRWCAARVHVSEVQKYIADKQMEALQMNMQSQQTTIMRSQN